MAMTREQWLLHAADLIRRDVKRAGVVVPPVAVSCSWPGGGSMHKRIGEAWPKAASKAGVNEVFISPKIEDPARVVGVLCHVLAHAALDCAHGHRAEFVRVAKLMGCAGQPTSMVPPTAISGAWAAVITAKHGPYPHRMVDMAKAGQKKQVNRQIKLECGECGAIWRMSRTQAALAQCCPCCRSEDFTIEVKG